MTHLFRNEPLNKSLLGVLATALLPIGAAYAGPGGSSSGGGVQGIAERELVRRQSAISEADAAVMEGDRYYAEKDYEKAISEYRRALDLYPTAAIAQAQRARATDRYAAASVKLAEQRAENGEYENSRAILQGVLADDIDPTNKDAKELLADLDDPEIWPVANSPEHMAKVQEVKKLLTLGQSQIELGQFDEARTTLNNVLVRDPYNDAARRMLERVERMVTDHYKTSRDHMRAHMLRQVDELWQVYVPNADLDVPVDIGPESDTGVEITVEKLRRIRIPEVRFDEATVEEAVDYLRAKSRDLDQFEADPAKRGVNIVIQQDTGGGGLGADGTVLAAPDASSKRISLNLSDVPLGEALRYVTELAGMTYRVEPFAVLVVPVLQSTEVLTTRVFRVPPNFLNSAGAALGGGGGADVDPFAPAGDAGGGGGLPQQPTAEDVLKAAGVTFPDGATAFFNKATSQLIVRNSASNIDLISQYVENLRLGGQTQIYITTKFVEVTQTNTDELGFDWLIGAFNVPGSDRVFGAGGTVGNSAAGSLNVQDYPFVPPGADVPVGTNPITRGLRFGTNAISDDAIDGLIREGVGVVSPLSPGIFGVAGVLTDPQFQVVIRALSQHKGVDLMSAPSVVTRSGQRAQIQVIREFIYPIEFDPPEIPQDFGSINSSGGFNPFTGFSSSSIASFPVTPTTPTAFETRNTGVTLEVEPVVGADNFTIDITLAPEVVEFEGFINYGSPIQTGATNSLGQPTTIVLTDNKIEQPVFSTRSAQTAVTIWDGQTVAIGGLIREDVQSVEDKVPIMGDIPLVGRLFRTKAESHFKRNLMIFVTAKLIDPAGQAIRGEAAPVSPTPRPSVPEPGPQPDLFMDLGK